MRRILLITFSSLILITAHSQVQEAWLQVYNGTDDWYDTPQGIVVDAAGNSYVLEGGPFTNTKILKYATTGDFLWIATVSGNPGAITLDAAGNVYTASNNGNYVVSKFSSSGAVIWTRSHSFGGAYDESAAIVVDNSGNVYVTGRADVDDAGFDETDYGLVKFNSAGDFQWARTYNGADPGVGEDYATGIALDGSGNIYITGTSQLNGQLDYATLKYNSAGTLQWIRRFNGVENHQDYGRKIIIDASNNIYVAGYSEGELYTGDDWYLSDVALIKYNTAGDQQWVSFVNAGTHDVFRDMTVDGSGNIFVASYYEITAPGTLRVSKFNSSGVRLWSKDGDNRLTEGRGSYIAKDGSGNIYVTAVKFIDDTYSDIVTIKLNTNGDQLWMTHFDGGRHGDDAKEAFLAVDANENVYMTSILNGLTATRDDVATHKYTQCSIICPSNITVDNDPGECGANVTFANATTTGYCGATITYTHNSGDFFPIGTTTVTVTSDETGASCSFTITVVDNEKPVFTICPSNKNVNTDANVCHASVAVGQATASDNCDEEIDAVGVRSDGKGLTENYPVGTTTIRWTATDPNNNTSTCSQTVTVVDNSPPVISGEAASIYVLSPPNHTMRDVTVTYTATDNCAVTAVVSVTSNEPVNGVGDGDTDPDWIVVDNVQVSPNQYECHLKLRAERSANGSGRIYTITITGTDPSVNTAAKTIEVRVPHNIKNPHSGKAFIVGSTINFEGEFWDKPGNKHTAKWIIDGVITAKATLTEPSGGKNGKVTGSYKFTTPGVYKLQMNITDQNGLTTYTSTAGDLEAIVVIFDPNGGHTYGGGFFTSPAGALTSNPVSTGKAGFGFAMNYFKNSTNPKGETQFKFNVGDFEFNALNFDYLVISNSMAQFKGTGKIIGGQSGVGFTMTVVDGQLDGTGIDKIRMKIYNKNTGAIIYDNQPGASDAALPSTAVGTNSVIVIQANNVSAPTTKTTNQQIDAESKTVNGLALTVYPNPASNYFNILVGSNNSKEKIVLQVFDQYGRLVEAKTNVSNGSMVRLGDLYKTGVYYVRVVQGEQHKEQKLIKLSD